jgi:lipoprotein-anchoring transpeptidase ErfK/SrfK
MPKDVLYRLSVVLIITFVFIAMGIFLFRSVTGTHSSAQTNEATSKSNYTESDTTKNDSEVSDKGKKNNNKSAITEEETSEKATEEETTINYKKLINFDSPYPYMIRVNLAKQWVLVYGIDYNGNYSVPYKIFICSTGRFEGATPKGAFSISDKYDWRLMVDYSYAQYAVRFNGPIMFHSVPYYSAHKNDLEVDEYNKLGTAASLGCVRLNVSSVKWIYDNCPVGTKVIVYSLDDEKAPLKLPKLKKAKSKGRLKGWDPTDPDEDNPWLNKESDIETTKDAEIVNNEIDNDVVGKEVNDDSQNRYDLSEGI